MYLVGQAFESDGRRWTVDTLSETLEVPSIALGPVVDALEAAGLLETTERETLVPGRDLAGIRLDQVLAAVRDGNSGRAMTLRRARLIAPAERLCDRVEAVIGAELSSQSLKDFIGAGESGVPQTPSSA